MIHSKIDKHHIPFAHIDEHISHADFYTLKPPILSTLNRLAQGLLDLLKTSQGGHLTSPPEARGDGTADVGVGMGKEISKEVALPSSQGGGV